MKQGFKQVLVASNAKRIRVTNGGVFHKRKGGDLDNVITPGQFTTESLDDMIISHVGYRSSHTDEKERHKLVDPLSLSQKRSMIEVLSGGINAVEKTTQGTEKWKLFKPPGEVGYPAATHFDKEAVLQLSPTDKLTIKEVEQKQPVLARVALIAVHAYDRHISSNTEAKSQLIALLMAMCNNNNDAKEALAKVLEEPNAFQLLCATHELWKDTPEYLDANEAARGNFTDMVAAINGEAQYFDKQLDAATRLLIDEAQVNWTRGMDVFLESDKASQAAESAKPLPVERLQEHARLQKLKIARQKEANPDSWGRDPASKSRGRGNGRGGRGKRGRGGRGNQFGGRHGSSNFRGGRGSHLRGRGQGNQWHQPPQWQQQQWQQQQQGPPAPHQMYHQPPPPQQPTPSQFPPQRGGRGGYSPATDRGGRSGRGRGGRG